MQSAFYFETLYFLSVLILFDFVFRYALNHPILPV
jgi:hypothetical protein